MRSKTRGRILVTGAVGQIGSELVEELREKYDKSSVVAAGHKTEPPEEMRKHGPFEFVDVLDREAMDRTIEKYDIDVIYHLGAILSVKGEELPHSNLSPSSNVHVKGNQAQYEQTLLLPNRTGFQETLH